MIKPKEIFYDDEGKVVDLSGTALTKADLLERKKLKKAKKKVPFNPLYDKEVAKKSPKKKSSKKEE